MVYVLHAEQNKCQVVAQRNDTFSGGNSALAAFLPAGAAGIPASTSRFGAGAESYGAAGFLLWIAAAAGAP